MDEGVACDRRPAGGAVGNRALSREHMSSDDEAPPKPDSPFASATIHHLALRVPDAEGSKRWFVEKLDFRVVCEWPMGEHRCAWLRSPGENGFIIEIVGGNSPEPNPEFETVEETLEFGGYHHVSIEVRSVAEALAELGRRGVRTVGDPFDVIPIGRRVAFVADPWGNMVELAERI
jgi:lactoylglutathione lyase/glyoxylase I family protein